MSGSSEQFKQLAQDLGQDIAFRLQKLTDEMPKAAPPGLMKAEEAAEYLKISVSKIREMVRLDAIPYVRFGSSVRFDPSRLRDWWLNRMEGADA